MTGCFQQNRCRKKRCDRHTGYRVIGTSDQSYHAGRNSCKEETENNDHDRTDHVDRNDRCHGNSNNEDCQHNEYNRHLQVFFRTQFICLFPGTLQSFHCICECSDDQRQGLDQTHNTACCHSTCTDITDIAAPDTGCAGLLPKLMHRNACRE